MVYKTRSPLEVVESPVSQSALEKRAYRFNWGAEGTPTAPTITVYDIAAASYVTTDVLEAGSPSVDSDYVVTPRVQLLTAGKEYKLNCLVTVGGNVQLAYTIIKTEA